MKVINNTEYDGKKYTLIDSVKFIGLKDLGLTTDYYGGRIVRIGTTDTKGVYLLIDAFDVFDILVDEKEVEVDLFKLTNAELRDKLDSKGIEYDDKAVKKDLVALLEG